MSGDHSGNQQRAGIDSGSMRRRSSALSAFFVVLALNLFASSNRPKYSSARIDGSGQLHIVLNAGREITPRRLKDQVAFSNASISPDHKTIGWLADFPDPGASLNKTSPIAGLLVLYRNGRLLHTFTTDQVFWDWRFVAFGGKIAYSTGPMHGGASECVLRDVTSGAIVARWKVDSGTLEPAWAKSLRF